MAINGKIAQQAAERYEEAAAKYEQAAEEAAGMKETAVQIAKKTAKEAAEKAAEKAANKAAATAEKAAEAAFQDAAAENAEKAAEIAAEKAVEKVADLLPTSSEAGEGAGKHAGKAAKWTGEGMGKHADKKPAKWTGEGMGKHADQKPAKWTGEGTGKHADQKPPKWTGEGAGKQADKTSDEAHPWAGAWQKKHDKAVKQATAEAEAEHAWEGAAEGAAAQRHKNKGGDKPEDESGDQPQKPDDEHPWADAWRKHHDKEQQQAKEAEGQAEAEEAGKPQEPDEEHPWAGAWQKQHDKMEKQADEVDANEEKAEKKAEKEAAKQDAQHGETEQAVGEFAQGVSTEQQSLEPHFNPMLMDEDGSKTRCGYSWVDASAKCGPPCATAADCSASYPWELLEDEKLAAASGAYECYKDLTACDPAMPAGECVSLTAKANDTWCMECAIHFNHRCTGFHEMCLCEDVAVPKQIIVEPEPSNYTDLPHRSKYRVQHLLKKHDKDDPRMPACTWAAPKACTNSTPYECMKGEKEGLCSERNWMGHPKCSAACIHESVLPLVPYAPVWRAGPPRAAPLSLFKNKIPHYLPKKVIEAWRPFSKFRSGVDLDHLVSDSCHSPHYFVVVTLYSATFTEKAKRLLASCDKVGVCCKATQLQSDSFGQDALEGSDSFRFQFLANKPAFIMEQLDIKQLPIVYMDSDLEFLKKPKLLEPGSWPDFPRDVALFNYWGNETKWENRKKPQIGSGIMFFNQTARAKRLVVAWVEAMHYKTNTHAPDDQVLDVLLKLNWGNWLRRASLGWFPAAYLHMMPAYYRGVDAVVEHDRGTRPGVIAHSATKPLLPKVIWWEKVEDYADPKKTLPKDVVAPWNKPHNQAEHDRLLSLALSGAGDAGFFAGAAAPTEGFSGVIGAPALRAGQQMRCGTSFLHASTECKYECAGGDSECPHGQSCFITYSCQGKEATRLPPRPGADPAIGGPSGILSGLTGTMPGAAPAMPTSPFVAEQMRELARREAQVAAKEAVAAENTGSKLEQLLRAAATLAVDNAVKAQRKS